MPGPSDKAKENANPKARLDMVGRRRAGVRRAHGLQNASKFPDDFLARKIESATDDVESYVGDSVDYQDDSAGGEAIRYYSLIQSYYYGKDDSGPGSVSEARRYDYDDTNCEYWASQLVAALSKINE